MNVTKTTNSSLALYTSLDPSHISRLRRGERNVVKDADYVKKMAVFFNRQCIEEYQKKALQEVLPKPAAQNDSENITERIYHWLFDSDLKGSSSINCFLEGLSNVQLKKTQYNRDPISLMDSGAMQQDLSLYYGLEGKREAVLRFLSLITEAKRPETLLLYSDEPMDWLTADQFFLAKWSDMLSRVIEQGYRIKIIHTVSRNLDEMLEAMSKWMPLYMTGAIEPYYYPKKRDGIFKRTLFIAPKTAALTSSSLEIMADKAVNILLKDLKAVDALAVEFNSYLNLCKPLMHIFTDKDMHKYLSVLEQFEKGPADTIIKSSNLSLATMPTSVAKAMLERSKVPRKKELMEFLLQRKGAFEKSLLSNCVCEIIKLPTIKSIKEGQIEVGFSETQEFSGLFYHPGEYRLHLENIIQFLLKYDNYQVSISKDMKDDGYRLYVKEDLGAIVVKTTNPQIVFAINESNMVAAFWDYLRIVFDENKPNRNDVIRMLRQYVDELK